MVEREKKTDLGTIKIHNEAIVTIASLAATEVEGVAKIASGVVDRIGKVLFGKRGYNRGIKVDIDDNDVKIDASIIVKYGVNIPEVANAVQENIKKSVEKMTGLSTIEVNVNIQSVLRGEEQG